MDVVPCMDSAVQANDLIELTPTVKMESGHPEEGPFGCEVLLGSHRGLKSQVIEDFGGKFAFFEKKNDHLWRNFQNSVPKELITSSINVLCANFVKFGRRKSVKSRIAYLTKKFVSLLLLHDRVQNLPEQRRTMYSECPKFHRNRFTSGRVIAEPVNNVETCDNLFPIFGQSLASSQIINNKS